MKLNFTIMANNKMLRKKSETFFKYAVKKF